MVTWQSLSKQAEQLSWREIAPQGYRQCLVLIWQLVRSPISGMTGQHLVKFTRLISTEDLQDISEASAKDCGQ